MRLCLIDDLLQGAIALGALPVEQWRQTADRLVFQAHAAHAYAKRFGRPHPLWGNGSLAARAMALGPFRGQPAMRFDALAVMALAVTAFRNRQRSDESLGCWNLAPYGNIPHRKGVRHGRDPEKAVRP